MRTIELDAYVLDTLMADLVGHDRQPSAFLVYLALWRRTRSEDVDEAAVSLRELAEATGLSRRGVQDALDRDLVRVAGLAGDLVAALDAGDGRADRGAGGDGHRAPPSVRTASVRISVLRASGTL